MRPASEILAARGFGRFVVPCEHCGKHTHVEPMRYPEFRMAVETVLRETLAAAGVSDSVVRQAMQDGNAQGAGGQR